MKRKTRQRIKRFFGLEKYSSYISNYFEKTNIRSGLYVSSVVMAIELFMIFSVVIRQFSDETRRTTYWFVTHIISYSVLFLSALGLFIHSVRYVKHKSKHPKWGQVLRVIFSIIAISFGIYISFMDYKKGEQFITGNNCPLWRFV